MKLSRCGALIALIAVGFAGCGNLTKSPAEGLTFKAPAGWTGSPGIMGMMQIWVAPAGASGKQELMIFKVPVAFKSDDVFKQADMKDAKIEESHGIKVCGNEPGSYLRLSATSERDKRHIEAEMVMLPQGSSSLMALYVRPFGMKPDAQAQSALYELCPAKT